MKTLCSSSTNDIIVYFYKVCNYHKSETDTSLFLLCYSYRMSETSLTKIKDT